ncbi:MAG: hypothetical protein K2K45_06200 [Muribaculaceae bacterium]|nr:hypothetical protein [Muribaculaceae bacterium]
MRNKYLLLGAASMLMLAACSEDLKGPEANRPAENGLNLTSLDAASQAGRVSLPGQTRGQKSERLQLVAKIAPVAESQAAVHNWSATGIAISNGVAYVSWHSNHQATVAADAWGGAIDVIDINALVDDRNANAITNTYVSESAKFNGIVASGSNLFLPITSYAKGALVGRWNRGSLAIDTISVPGVSANSVEVVGNTVYAVSGYAGGVYSFPADFDVESHEAATELIPYDANFGGKYIDGGLVLRTDDEKMQILSLDGTVRNEGAPLVSAEKKAEVYNPENGGWNVVDGTEATHYGKHTMAVDGNYRYVGGGQGANGENGLRVYQGTGLVWQNGNNTTAVSVEGDYVFAATGMGLRVYEKYNGTDMPLFAFEVMNYDENGNAAKDPEKNIFVGGTDAHSCNFVKYDQVTGLVFVACGQSGVYVFRLNTNVEVAKWPTGITTEGGYRDVTDIDEGDTGKFIVPEAPATEEGEDFVNWEDQDGETHNPGEEVELESGKVLELKPVLKPHEYAYVLKFDGNKAEGITVSNLPAEQKSDDAKIVIPNVKPTVPAGTLNPEFIGWATDPEMSVAHKEAGLWTPIMPGDEYTCTQKETTLYAIWATNITAGGNQGGVVEEPQKPENPGGSAGDVKPGTMN